MIKTFSNRFLIHKIGNYWAAQRANSRPSRTRWWESPLVVRHYNAQICGQPLAGTSQGIVAVLKQRFGARLPFKKGISVAGSNGWKERILISAGIVEHFVVTEYSEALIEEGRKLSAGENLQDRIHFFHGDAFTQYPDPEAFDFVYWDNSLHHMLDVYAAVEWSKNVLKPAGLFVMNDYVAPSRMQYSDESLKHAALGRAFLPEKYLQDPCKPGSTLPRSIKRCNPHALAASDPSECADSGRILAAVEQHFPNASTTLTGGTIYNSALQDILANFDEEDETDCCVLNLLLHLDQQFALAGDTHYAFSLAQKD